LTYDRDDRVQENHRFRTLPFAAPPAAFGRTTPDLTRAFDEWLESRQNRIAGTNYPVFLVSAQGGGLYAAYNAGLVLARIQDR
jgi:hypothetical protein